MAQAAASPSLEPAGKRSLSPDRAPPSPPTVSGTKSAQPIEIVAPDRYCTALLLQYVAPLFPAAIVSGPAWIVRLQPPAGGTWVLQLLALVERWLESAPLPCATVLYGGRSYLIRAPIGVAQFAAAAESAPA